MLSLINVLVFVFKCGTAFPFERGAFPTFLALPKVGAAPRLMQTDESDMYGRDILGLRRPLGAHYAPEQRALPIETPCTNSTHADWTRYDLEESWEAECPCSDF